MQITEYNPENLVFKSTTCQVCWEDYELDQKITLLVGCGHFFHTACVSEEDWSECCICRKKIQRVYPQEAIQQQTSQIYNRIIDFTTDLQPERAHKFAFDFTSDVLARELKYSSRQNPYKREVPRPLLILQQLDSYFNLIQKENPTHWDASIDSVAELSEINIYYLIKNQSLNIANNEWLLTLSPLLKELKQAYMQGAPPQEKSFSLLFNWMLKKNNLYTLEFYKLHALTWLIDTLPPASKPVLLQRYATRVYMKLAAHHSQLDDIFTTRVNAFIELAQQHFKAQNIFARALYGNKLNSFEQAQLQHIPMIRYAELAELKAACIVATIFFLFLSTIVLTPIFIYDKLIRRQ